MDNNKTPEYPEKFKNVSILWDLNFTKENPFFRLSLFTSAPPSKIVADCMGITIKDYGRESVFFQAYTGGSWHSYKVAKIPEFYEVANEEQIDHLNKFIKQYEKELKIY